MRSPLLCLTSLLSVLPSQVARAGDTNATEPSAWLVLYNLESPESVRWKRWYADQWGIPDANALGLTCSTDEKIEQQQEMGFVATIYDPVREFLIENPEVEEGILGIRYHGWHGPPLRWVSPGRLNAASCGRVKTGQS